MSGYVNIILAVSNIAAIPTIIRAARAGDTLLAIIVMMAATSSCLMHISEQKHQLRPVLFGKYADVLLNIDRAAVCVTFVAAVSRWLRAGKPPAPLAAAALGGTLCVIGETVFAADTIKYMVIHLIWHMIAYRSIGMLVFCQ